MLHAWNQRWNVPLRSSTILPGYISLNGGKIAGAHVWKWRKKLILREKTANNKNTIGAKCQLLASDISELRT